MSVPADPGRLEAWARAAPCPEWARAGLRGLLEAGVDLGRWPARAGERLARVLGASRAAGRWALQDPEIVGVLLEPEVERALGVEDYLERIGPPPREPAGVLPWLRRARAREMLRIVAREAAGIAPIEVTAGEISAFAEACVRRAFEAAWAELTRAHGEPEGQGGRVIPGCVLGMGKLAGRELNLSSDVDLVFLYGAAEGRTRGGPGGVLDVHEFFARLVARVTEILGRITAEGLVFRVDLGLRPEGQNGPPAQPVENAVLYYQSWGQTWERAVLMKARPVAGDLALGWAFLREVEPFVYRRSLDYTTVEDLKEMKLRIDRGAARRLGGGDDIKLGLGGIREVEFFVQTLQLIHGGRMPGVRTPSTLEGLERLRAAGVIDAETASGLARCYRFLRSLEHAIQALHFRQTHRLPSSPEELGAVARRLGFGDPPALLAALDDVRSEVHAVYGRLMHGAGKEWEERVDDEARELLSLEPGPQALERLREAGFRHPHRAWEGLRLLRDGPGRGPPSPRSRRILSRIAPFLLAEVRRSPDPDRALLHLGEFLAASGARSTFLSLLEENPATVRLLLTLFGSSEFLSRYLVSHPELLDELVLGSSAAPDKPAADMDRELSAALERCRDDEEEALDVLRRFRNAEFLRIALNDLWGALSPDQVTRQLTRVAETCLAHALRLAGERLRAKYGPPLLEDGRPAGFAVLGLGKLGGEEIDYHSDLDVVFVYEGPGRTGGAGGRSLTNAEYFARLAQRLMSALSARTREGLVFRMDARLRPSGRAGPLVTSLEAFESYHREGSEIWERQALIRLRPVAGDPDLGRRTRDVVDRVVFGGPPREDPRPEIARMRRRIEREVGQEERGQVHLKAGPGGLVDVEFAVQALQLLHGWRGPGLRSPNTLGALGALEEAGVVPADVAEVLAEGYRFLRRVESRLRILTDRPTDVLPRDPERLGELARGLGYGGKEPGEALMADVLGHRARIRRAYLRVMEEE